MSIRGSPIESSGLRVSKVGISSCEYLGLWVLGDSGLRRGRGLTQVRSGYYEEARRGLLPFPLKGKR